METIERKPKVKGFYFIKNSVGLIYDIAYWDGKEFYSQNCSCKNVINFVLCDDVFAKSEDNPPGSGVSYPEVVFVNNFKELEHKLRLMIDAFDKFSKKHKKLSYFKDKARTVSVEELPEYVQFEKPEFWMIGRIIKKNDHVCIITGIDNGVLFSSLGLINMYQAFNTVQLYDEETKTFKRFGKIKK